MNQPAQALTFDQLTTIERGTFDAFAAISSAMAFNLIIGIGMQSEQGEDGQGRPIVTIICHPDKEDGEPQPLVLACPQNGPNFYALLAEAGKICQEVLNEYQQKSGRASAHFIAAQDVAKVRRKGRSALILPGGRN